ncbi:hypothetical protein BGX33_000432 [Mortierella sp. NVP41]|nr:hypothetical protein BGX33_000432 [Mortierella sp. NVP41]
MTIAEVTTNPSVDDSQKKKPLHGLYAVLEKARIESGIYGMAVSVLHKGELIFAEGFGKRNAKDPFTKDTLMPIGSCSKAFTATAIGELVAEGKMDWDKTPVNTYLPEFEVKDPVVTSQLTLEDLLSHRTNQPRMDLRWIESEESTADLIKALRHAEYPSKLTSKLNYNNYMYAVAGEAAARVAGVSYEKLVETKILEPLGLTNTGFSQSALPKYSDYALPFDAASFEDAQKGNFIQGELDKVPLSVAAAGDLHSNVLDLARWGRVVLKEGELDGKQILNKEKNIAETLTGRTFMTGARRTPDFAPVLAYGLGWMIDAYKGHTFYHHTGGISTFVSSITVYPDLDLVVSVLCNFGKAYIVADLHCYIVDELLGLPKTEDWLFDNLIKKVKSLYEKSELAAKGPLPKRIENKPHVHALQEYVGEYTEGTYGDVSISLHEEEEDATNTDADHQQGQKEKKQVLYFKYGGFHNKMEHYHFETFKVVLKLFWVAEGLGINFQTGSDGKVVGFVWVESDFEGSESKDKDTAVKIKQTVFKRKENKVDTTTAAKEE